jgi:hypothetical protein
MARGHWVRRERGGRVVLRFEPVEAETLVAIVDDVRHALESGEADDPVTRRLFPRAYLDPTEESAEDEWKALVHPDLLRTRLDALGAVTATLAEPPNRRGIVEIALDEERADQWVTVLNDARLALGTVLGVTEETELDDFAPGDERRSTFLLYGALTALQGELVDALLESI